MPTPYEVALSVLFSDNPGGGGMSHDASQRTLAREIASRIAKELEDTEQDA